MSRKDLRKVLADAVRQHACRSAIDRTPTKAVNTMIAALFNILGSQPLDLFNTIDERYYIDFMAPERMKDLPTIMAMTNAYQELVKASAPFQDVLTDLASEFLGRDGKDLGQFMTPRDLAMLVAEMAIDPDLKSYREKVQRGEMIKVADPCGSGTGSLLLAVLHKLRREAPELLPNVGVYGVDVDVDMARTTAVQIIWNCLLHDIRVAHVSVWHANALVDYLAKPPMVVFDPLKYTQNLGVQEWVGCKEQSYG